MCKLQVRIIIYKFSHLFLCILVKNEMGRPISQTFNKTISPPDIIILIKPTTLVPNNLSLIPNNIPKIRPHTHQTRQSSPQRIILLNKDS